MDFFLYKHLLSILKPGKQDRHTDFNKTEHRKRFSVQIFKLICYHYYYTMGCTLLPGQFFSYTYICTMLTFKKLKKKIDKIRSKNSISSSI